MKYFLLLILFISSLAFGAKEKSRKIGNSNYSLCQVERDASDKKAFKKEYYFPFPVDQGEQYEIKASQRWNKLSIVFHQEGKVVIKIAEQFDDEMVSATKTHQLGKEPQFESFKVQLDLKKGDKVIPYLINCGPE